MIKVNIHKIIKKIFLIILISIIVLTSLLLLLSISDEEKLLPPVEKKDVFKKTHISSYPSRLKTQGNNIINADGETIILKGIMAPDPQKVNLDGNFNEAFYRGIFKAGGNCIRVPVHPKLYISDEYYLWRYLDKIVTWAGENDQYVIIDLHFIGNIANGSGDEMVDVRENPKDFSLSFWKRVANYFKDASNVIFEIYNEPAFIRAENWTICANKLVDTIRESGAEQLIIVGGIDYSYDLSWVNTMPIQDDNIAYAAHVFPSRDNWDYYFGKTAESYPVVVTEWGYIDENRYTTTQQYLVGNQKEFGEPLIEYMENHNIGWIACWYDNEWEPQMFSNNFKDMTNWGRFAFKQLK